MPSDGLDCASPSEAVCSDKSRMCVGRFYTATVNRNSFFVVKKVRCLFIYSHFCMVDVGLSLTACRRFAWVISQAGKSAYFCKDLVMRKTSDPTLNVSNSKTVCSTNFKFGGCFDQGHCHKYIPFCVDLSRIMSCVELLVMLNWVACIKISWKFASNIKAFFSSFQAISDLSFGGLVDHYLTIADVKNENDSLIM